jgi:hypothetical protein
MIDTAHLNDEPRFKCPSKYFHTDEKEEFDFLSCFFSSQAMPENLRFYVLQKVMMFRIRIRIRVADCVQF